MFLHWGGLTQRTYASSCLFRIEFSAVRFGFEEKIGSLKIYCKIRWLEDGNKWSSTVFVLLQKPTPKPRQRTAQADKKVSFPDLSTIQMGVSFTYFARAC